LKNKIHMNKLVDAVLNKDTLEHVSRMSKIRIDKLLKFEMETLWRIL
jgi:hypothetical protein